MTNHNKDQCSSHAFNVGQIVVFKHISWQLDDLSGFYSDHLHVITHANRESNYLEIEETKCAHSNHRTYGTDGTDIRLASSDELRARHRLPKTISFTSENPHGEVVFIHGRNDVLKIVHYTNENRLLLIDKENKEIEVEIFDIREARLEERDMGIRTDEPLCLKLS
jgi:hypothetical protein